MSTANTELATTEAGPLEEAVAVVPIGACSPSGSQVSLHPGQLVRRGEIKGSQFDSLASIGHLVAPGAVEADPLFSAEAAKAAREATESNDAEGVLLADIGVPPKAVEKLAQLGVQTYEQLRDYAQANEGLAKTGLSENQQADVAKAMKAESDRRQKAGGEGGQD